jgi:hypothetical protein
MLQKMRALLLVCITAVLAACSGGGGDDTPNFAGTYLFNGNMTSNNCNIAVTNVYNGTDVLTQNGRAIAMNSGGIIFNGSIDNDNGGITITNTQTSNGVPVVSTLDMRIKAGNEHSFKVTVAAGSCSVVYGGTATKL